MRGAPGDGLAVTRAQVLAFRVRAHQLDRSSGTVADTAVLDLGVQDSGADGAGWALANRGVTDPPADALVMLWTLRGAPTVYRRADLADVAAAVAPFSEADAAKRVFDAARPLRAAGIPVLDALDAVAAAMRSLVSEPMVKGEVSGGLAQTMDDLYLRFCRSCDSVHLYEQPFRLAAVRAGLELQPGTSPPVLAPIPGFAAAEVPAERFDVIRAALRLLGPATPQHVAVFLDAPVREVKARWPADAEALSVAGKPRWLLAEDVEALRQAGPVAGTRLLGPFDLFLQARDRDLLVPDPARAKALWPVLGRPGALLHDGDLAGLWRPRASGGRLSVEVEAWQRVAEEHVAEQAERLAAHRGLRLQALRFA